MDGPMPGILAACPSAMLFPCTAGYPCAGPSGALLPRRDAELLPALLTPSVAATCPSTPMLAAVAGTPNARESAWTLAALIFAASATPTSLPRLVGNPMPTLVLYPSPCADAIEVASEGDVLVSFVKPICPRRDAASLALMASECP